MILITGVAGFIGSHLAEYYLDIGKKVVGLDNFDLFYDKAIKLDNLKFCKDNPDFTFYDFDVRNESDLIHIFTKHEIDIVIHLAAKAGVRPSIADPQGYFDVNVTGTLNLLQTMKTFKVNKLVYASSSSVYGNSLHIPFEENNSADKPISPYAASKRAGELLTFNYFHLCGINSINLRFFTVFGPRQRPDLAIHKFFRSIYFQEPIMVFGDGNTSRDYTFIDDIIDGIYNASDYLKKHSNVYEVINLGNSNPVKLDNLLNSIEEITERKFIKKHLPMQEGDVISTFANIGKAARLINFHPETSLSIGLMKFNEWFQAHYFIDVAKME